MHAGGGGEQRGSEGEGVRQDVAEAHDVIQVHDRRGGRGGGVDQAHLLPQGRFLMSVSLCEGATAQCLPRRILVYSFIYY